MMILSVKNDYGILTFVSKLDGYKKVGLIEVSVNRAIIFGDLLSFIHIKRFFNRCLWFENVKQNVDITVTMPCLTDQNIFRHNP